MSTLYVLVGLPGSGKSTWAKMQEEAIWLSSDAIRAELYGSEEVQDNPSKVFNLMFKRTVEALNSGKDVIYDATNTSRKRRTALIRDIKNKTNGVTCCAVVFATPIETCIERNNARDRKVPEEVIYKMYKSFNVPFYSEGFSVILLIKEKPIKNILEEKLIAAKKIEQDNPHHTLTIGNHCKAAFDFIFNSAQSCTELDYYDWVTVLEAAKYHDIGKPFCKTYTKPNGHVDTVAHFYSHENVGAYDYLCYSEEYDAQAIYIALLINLHMIFYTDEVHQKKMHEFYGNGVWKMLNWVHKADEAAH